MTQFTHAEEKTVVGQRQLFCRYKAFQKHASDTVHLRARWHTRTQRRTRIQRPNALNRRLCTVHNGTRSGEGQPTTLKSWTQRSSIQARAKQTCGDIIPKLRFFVRDAHSTRPFVATVHSGHIHVFAAEYRPQQTALLSALRMHRLTPFDQHRRWEGPLSRWNGRQKNDLPSRLACCVCSRGHIPTSRGCHLPSAP